MILFFICENSREAEQKALGLRLNGYNTQIKEVKKTPHGEERIYKVFAERMDRWEIAREKKA